MKKIVIQFILIFTILFVLFKYNYEIKVNLYNTLINIMRNILPSMFPILFITNYINENINIKNKVIKFISLSLSFSPSNILLSLNNKEIIFSSNINPLFSFIMLKQMFNKYTALKIIMVNLIINYIFLFKSIIIENKKITNKDISCLIKKTTEGMINICGTIVFFNIIISIFNILFKSKIIVFAEICNGFNIIKKFKEHKLFYATLLNSFGGLSIYFQMKSINNNFKYRIILYKFIISLLITFITLLII